MPAFVSPANLRLNTTKPDNALRVRKRARPSSQALPTTATSVGRLSRRSLSRLLLSAAFVLAPAKQSPAASRQQNDKDDLRARLSKRIPPRPRNGVRQRDLVFPEHCLGTWRVASTLTSVSAPAGYRLFGRTGALEDALEGVGESVEYNARFIRSPLGVVPDRAYNVAAIADAAMGEGSVLDCAADSPDVLSATLRPRAAGGNAFVVNARVLFRDLQTGPAPARVGEDESDALADMLWSEGGREGEALYASEMIRQTVTLDNGDLRARPLVKDVETTTVVFEPDGGGFNALQRTATFLTRDDLRYVDAKGAPVDVRVYVLRYTRQQ